MNIGKKDGGRPQQLSVKDAVTVVASITALLLSLYNFAHEHLFNQRVLKAMVVGVGGQNDDLVTGDVLFINGGTHYEALYDANFVFGADIAAGKPIIAEGGIRATVIKPGEQLIVTLTGKRPQEIKCAVEGASGEIQVGVRFRAFDKRGTFANEGKVFRYTMWKYENGHAVAAVPLPNGNEALMDLLD